MRSTFTSRSLLCLAAAFAAISGARAQTPAQWQAEQFEASRKSEVIMKDANKRDGLLAQYLFMRDAYLRENDPAFHVIFGQYFSWYQTFIGDYPGAALSFSISQPAQPDDRPSPLSGGTYTAVPALDAIPKLARHARAVFFNEAHNIPLTRSLTVQLLSRLRDEGFTYFAAETLYQSDIKAMQKRGYPIGSSGFYTDEPVCAEMVRTALTLGFKVIAYEAQDNATGDARETEQAQNLYRQVFANDPNARLVVDAGYAHIQESGEFLGGSSMAEHFHTLTGINPLTIEQTMLIPHPQSQQNHPYYTDVMGKLHPTQPLIFVDAAGHPWSLRKGYDVSVFFPPRKLNYGRPTWLTLGNLRQPFSVTATTCRQDFPCLVEARYADEGADAIAADRLVFDPVRLRSESSYRFEAPKTASVGNLYLRPGKYQLSFLDAAGTVLSRRQISVASQRLPATDPAPSKTRANMASCNRAGNLPAKLQSLQNSCSSTP